MSQQQLAATTHESAAPSVNLIPLGSDLGPRPSLAARLLRGAATALLRSALLFVTLIVIVLSIGPVTGRYRTLTVLSGSMRPWLQPGDIVVVTPVQARDLRVGDVITYHLPGDGRRLVTHRIVKIVEPGDLPLLQTKGDANNTPDTVARLEESRVWRGRMAVPKVGWALNAMRSPKMRLLGSVLAPILLLGIWLLRIWAKRPDDEDDAGPVPMSPDLGATAPGDLARPVPA